MASRRGDTFDKRQRERRRQEKAADKRARRLGQPSPNGPLIANNEEPNSPALNTVIEDFTPKTSDERELIERYTTLKTHHDAGGIDKDTFELLRMDIFEKLGIDA